MTLALCKETLDSFIADAENRVVSLSGKWGTGKSHLWREVQKGSKDALVKEAVYLSLFGVGSIGDLKLKAVQGVLPKIESGGQLAEAAKRSVAAAKKVLTGIHSGFSALDDLALIALPTLLKNRFIVLDDIERKHEGLSIEELLGFIDDSVQNLNCRFLLILNDDKLKNGNVSTLWQEFHEKVIDQEIRLDTSPVEAFQIANEGKEFQWTAHVKEAVEICQISNIRVIRKIVRLLNRILGQRDVLAPNVLTRVVGPTTLLAAIHLRALEDGPDARFVLDYSSNDPYFGVVQQPELQSKEAAERRRWIALMDRLRLRKSDGFERTVYEFLRSGMLVDEDMRLAIDQFSKNHLELATATAVNEFVFTADFDIHTPNEQLLEKAREFLPLIHHLDMHGVSALCIRVELLGDVAMAREIVDLWIDAFRRKHATSTRLPTDLQQPRTLRGSVVPPIEAEIAKLRDRVQSKATLLEVFEALNHPTAWGERETTLLRSITSAEFQKAILSASPTDLRLLLIKGVDIVARRDFYEPTFGSASDQFLDACRSLLAADVNAKLSQLIRAVFGAHAPLVKL